MPALLLVLSCLLLAAPPVGAQEGPFGPLPEWMEHAWWMRRQLADPVILRDVHVVDVRTGTAGEATDVVMEGDLIVAVGDAGDVSAGRVLELAGHYVIPGLFDLHAHVLPASDRFGGPPPEETLEVLLDHGVTTIRLLPLTSQLAVDWAGRVAAGDLVGPTIVPAGGLMEKEPQRSTMGFGDAETAAAWVRREALVGAKWIKVYNSMDEASLAAIVATAEELGLRVCGHAHDVTAHRAAALGMHCFEHITGLPRGALPDGVLPPDGLGLAERTAWTWEHATEEGLEELLTIMLEHDTSWVPTLVVTDAIATHGSHDFGEPVDQDVRDRLHAVNAQGARLAVAFHRRGGAVGVGSDFPVDGVEPGVSVHRELQLLVELGGATPAEALAMATLGSARVLGFERLLGVVEPDHLAHLVVLEGNPLEDLSHLGDIALVIHDGRVVGED